MSAWKSVRSFPHACPLAMDSRVHAWTCNQGDPVPIALSGASAEQWVEGNFLMPKASVPVGHHGSWLIGWFPTFLFVFLIFPCLTCALTSLKCTAIWFVDKKPGPGINPFVIVFRLTLTMVLWICLAAVWEVPFHFLLPKSACKFRVNASLLRSRKELFPFENRWIVRFLLAVPKSSLENKMVTLTFTLRDGAIPATGTLQQQCVALTTGEIQEAFNDF